jgi:hypothetical protein
MPDHVDAKPVDAAAQPEPHHLVHGRAYVAIAPVQVRLRREERVVIGLPGRLVELPSRAAEFRQPVVGRSAAGRAVAPDVSVAFGATARRPALRKPWMPVRGVVGNEVEQHLHAQRMRRHQQRMEIAQCTEQRVDSRVVGKCRSRNRPSARERSATATTHRRRARRDTASARRCPANRRRRRRSSPETSADRSGRGPRISTIACPALSDHSLPSCDTKEKGPPCERPFRCRLSERLIRPPAAPGPPTPRLWPRPWRRPSHVARG